MGARGPKSKAELAIGALKGAPRTRPPARDPRLPRTLGEHGMALWRAITDEYAIETAAACELLCQACQALDRAESCRAQVETDGVIVAGKDHPLLKHELAARAFCARVIQRLELELQ